MLQLIVDQILLITFIMHCKVSLNSAFLLAMSQRDPPYVTPRIKLLLRKRNKLRCSDRCEEADNIALEINDLTARNRNQPQSGIIRSFFHRYNKIIRSFRKNTGNWGARKDTFSCDIDVD